MNLTKDQLLDLLRSAESNPKIREYKFTTKDAEGNNIFFHDVLSEAINVISQYAPYDISDIDAHPPMSVVMSKYKQFRVDKKFVYNRNTFNEGDRIVIIKHVTDEILSVTVELVQNPLQTFSLFNFPFKISDLTDMYDNYFISPIK